MEAEPESPIPPTPPREATPEPEIKEDSPEVTETKETKSSNPSKEESSKGSNSGHSRRGRRKVHKNKTYMDKDGFMGRKSLLCLLNIFRYFKVITNTFFCFLCNRCLIMHLKKCQEKNKGVTGFT